MASYPVYEIAICSLGAYVLATTVATLIAMAGFPLPPPNRRLGCIDGLRGYLSISVLIHHFIIWTQVSRLGGAWSPPSISLFNQLGAGGVALFFMTTGFVFYPRILAGFKNCSWTTIYISRIFRILPLTVFSLLLIIIIIVARIGLQLDWSFPIAATKWVIAWSEPPLLGYSDSGRINAYVLWSLWYEWLFYVFVLPGCAYTIDLIKGRVPSWIVPLLLILISLCAKLVTNPISMLNYLPLFAIGMIAFEIQSCDKIASVMRSPSMSFVAVGALGVAMILTPTPYAFAMPIFGFFFVCISCGNSMGGLLQTKGALVLGECSFGIYLLHGIVLYLMFENTNNLLDSLDVKQLQYVLPLVAATLVLFAAVTYIIIERPGIRFGKTLANFGTNKIPRGDDPQLNVAP